MRVQALIVVLHLMACLQAADNSSSNATAGQEVSLRGNLASMATRSNAVAQLQARAARNCRQYGCQSGYRSDYKCQCNRQCSEYNNCCSDYYDWCTESHSPSPFNGMIR
eukprot:TRINITY_DN42347_c0_g1_i1.p1 TRINITY_DN42347_c0_g1~~TRINITY_DN42347_c0_g1_i1.p1  ORF type:complete len:109 (-),score=14.75 TRINITY_DN42347_c0_g1_i1:160-486(-)